MVPMMLRLPRLVVMFLVTAGCVCCLSLPGPARPQLRLGERSPALVLGGRGGEVVLRCSASGSPLPRVAWYRDSLFLAHLEDQEDLQEDGQASLGETVAQLVLSCLREEDGGQYECRAVSGGQQLSAVTQLRVERRERRARRDQAEPCTEPARPQISEWSPLVMVEQGSSITLPCRLGRPGHNTTMTITTSWRDSRGQEVVGRLGGRLRVSQSGDLEISGVNWADMGQYTCTVSNRAGTASIQTFIYPLASRARGI